MSIALSPSLPRRRGRRTTRSPMRSSAVSEAEVVSMGGCMRSVAFLILDRSRRISKDMKDGAPRIARGGHRASAAGPDDLTPGPSSPRSVSGTLESTLCVPAASNPGFDSSCLHLCPGDPMRGTLPIRLASRVWMLAAVCAISYPRPAGAASGGEGTVLLPPLPQLRAAPVTGSIPVDGRLDEPAWAQAEAANEFTQLDPEEGKPASERTEVRVLVGNDALYVGARLFDREAGRIKRPLARRDDPVESD